MEGSDKDSDDGSDLSSSGSFGGGGGMYSDEDVVDVPVEQPKPKTDDEI